MNSVLEGARNSQHVKSHAWLLTRNSQHVKSHAWLLTLHKIPTYVHDPTKETINK